jgi:hypothetical protein
MQFPPGGKSAITAGDFLILANTYIQTINRGAVPTINDAWGEVVESKARGAIEKAAKHY